MCFNKVMKWFCGNGEQGCLIPLGVKKCCRGSVLSSAYRIKRSLPVGFGGKVVQAQWQAARTPRPARKRQKEALRPVLHLQHNASPSVTICGLYCLIFRNKANEIIIIRVGHDQIFVQYYSIGNNDDVITKKLAHSRGFICKIGMR